MAALNEQNAPASATPASDNMEVAKSTSNKQNKPIRATAPTNDEVAKLAGQFEKLLAEVSTTPTSPSSPTPTTAIVPIKKTAPSPPQQSRPSKTNPFYTTSDLTLGTAATKIHSILHAALLFINHLRTLDVNSVSAIVQKSSPDAQLNRLCADLRYVLEFLRFGREGWELTYLPHQFFKDVLPMVDELKEKMRDLVEKANGGNWVSEKGVLVLKDIGMEMVGVQKKRMVKEKEAKKAKKEGAKKEKESGEKNEAKEIENGAKSEAMEKTKEEAKETEKGEIGKADSVMEE